MQSYLRLLGKPIAMRANILGILLQLLPTSRPTRRTPTLYSGWQTVSVQSKIGFRASTDHINRDPRVIPCILYIQLSLVNSRVSPMNKQQSRSFAWRVSESSPTSTVLYADFWSWCRRFELDSRNKLSTYLTPQSSFGIKLLDIRPGFYWLQEDR